MRGSEPTRWIPFLGIMTWFPETFNISTREELGAPIRNLSSVVDNDDPAPVMRVTNPLTPIRHLISKCRHLSTIFMTVDRNVTSLFQIAYARLSFQEKASVQLTILSILGRLAMTFAVDISCYKRVLYLTNFSLAPGIFNQMGYTTAIGTRSP